jgi:adenylate cyclase
MNTTANNSCVLFAEICGTAKLYEKLGDTEALRAVERCLNRMERASAGYKGRVVKTLGDELMAVFESAESALHAAVEMQQRIDSLPPASGISLAVRVAFHYGPAAEEEDDDTFVGTVNVAARAMMLAKPGQVLATAEAVAVLPPALQELTREIEVPLSAKDETIRVFDVKWDHGGDEVRTRVAAQAAMPASPAAAPDPAPVPAAAEPAKPSEPSKLRLKLRYGDSKLILGPERPTATLGRDVKADIVVRDARASRHHGRIERRFDRFVLIDQSTNGTYVTVRGEAEFLLKQEETVLRGRGRINFGHSGVGHSGVGEEGDHLEFEVLE